MKNLTKTICALAIVLAFACQKEDIPFLREKETSVSIPTHAIYGIGGVNTTSIASNTPGTVGEVHTIDTVKTLDSMRVYYSDWFTPGTSTPGTTSTGSTTGQGNSSGTTTPSTTALNQSNFFNKYAPAITQDILDKGIVLAYCRLSSDGFNTRPLPANTTTSGVLTLWNYVLSLHNIQFTQYFMSPMAIYAIDNTNKFRYVVIPGTTHLRLKKQLNDMTYDEVCALFHIPL